MLAEKPWTQWDSQRTRRNIAARETEMQREAGTVADAILAGLNLKAEERYHLRRVIYNALYLDLGSDCLQRCYESL